MNQLTSSALAIASATAILKDLLDNRLAQRGVTALVGDLTVTARPPDRIPVGAEERPQVNLFLFRITPNTRWRGARHSNGDLTPNGRAALLLDLHYLVTAYGEQDFQSEILLGYVVQVLHATPILTRDVIRASLDSFAASGSSGTAAQTRVALASSTLTAVEQIEIEPEFLNTEEASRLWSALQARYRPSAAYRLSTVVIEAYE